MGQIGFSFPCYSSWIYRRSPSWPLVSKRTPLKKMEGGYTNEEVWPFLREMGLTWCAKEFIRIDRVVCIDAERCSTATPHWSMQCFHIWSHYLNVVVISRDRATHISDMQKACTCFLDLLKSVGPDCFQHPSLQYLVWNLVKQTVTLVSKLVNRVHLDLGLGLWLGHFNTWICCYLNYSIIALAVFFLAPTVQTRTLNSFPHCMILLLPCFIRKIACRRSYAVLFSHLSRHVGWRRKVHLYFHLTKAPSSTCLLN